MKRNLTVDECKKLTVALEQIRKICEKGQAYSTEARIYKIANDVLKELGK